METIKQHTTNTIQAYGEATERIRHAGSLLDPFATLERLKQFSFFSANLTNFLPLLDYSKHLHIYKDAYINQRLSLLDEQYFGEEVPLDVCGWEDSKIADLLDRPSIICTLHAGSYRYVTYLLTKSNVRFAVLISGQAVQKQGEGFKQRYADWYQRRGTVAELPIIDAENPRAIWEMIRLVKSGYHVVVYLDGFTGLPTPQKELQRVPLFAQHIFVRKGVSFLAHKLGLPLVPILCLRSKNAIEVVYDTPICPSSLPLEVFSSLALTRVFAFFANQLVLRPAQWENWFFLHHQLNTTALNKHMDTLFFEGMDEPETLPQPTHYGLYTHHDRFFLLEKWGYTSYELKQDYFDLIWSAWRQL